VEIFDGRGASRQGVIEKAVRGGVLVSFGSPAAAEPARARTLTLALSPPRGERMAFAVEKLSELGCDRVVPVIFRRSEDAGVRAGTGKIAKWRRRAIEAAKQCGRNRLLVVDAPLPLDEVLGLLHPRVKLIVLEPGAPIPLREALEKARSAAETMILVGPEGGLIDEERNAIRGAGGEPARLFEHVLRIETAAVAASAVYGSTSS
jgi:16S rRNA (uracil1498-N3)-methyltransferase